MNNRLLLAPKIAHYVADVVAQHREVRQPIATRHLGHTFSVAPGVFSPFIAPSGCAGLSFASLPMFRRKRILDIGCGSGVIACLMALSGASRVVGVDINPVAVENAQRNAGALGLDSIVDVRVGDLLGPIAPDEDFDIIYADLPFTEGQPSDALEAAFFDPNLDSIRRLVQELPVRLRSPHQRAYLCISGLDGLNWSDVVEGQHLQHRVVMQIDLDWMGLLLTEIKKGY